MLGMKVEILDLIEKKQSKLFKRKPKLALTVKFILKQGKSLPDDFFEWTGTIGAYNHIGVVRGYTTGSSTFTTSKSNKDNQSRNFSRNLSNVEGFIYSSPVNVLPQSMHHYTTGKALEDFSTSPENLAQLFNHRLRSLQRLV